MSRTIVALPVVALLLSASGSLHGGFAARLDRWRRLGVPYIGKVSWFNQTLDHFSPTDKRTFQQRYFEVTDFFEKPAGPVFLYICGEAPCPGIAQDFILSMAEEMGAAVVALEHRYYGESQPFADISTEHLAYLNTQQALADLAMFRQFYQRKLTSQFALRRRGVRAGGENKWVVLGISYAGAMSAWFRLKYPHLVHASLASSAVVDVILDFYQFDQQVLESAGPQCGAALQEVTAAVEALLASDPARAKALFRAEALEDDRDFLFLVADSAVFAFQYGLPDAVCDPLEQAKEKGGDVLAAFVNYTRDVFYHHFGVQPADYDQAALKDPSLGPRSDSRAWWFQCCTEMAYFQNAPPLPEPAVRSRRIDMQYWRDFCSNIYGDGVFPNTAATNTFYGSTGIAGSKIVFTNGSQDPWKRASRLTPTASEPSIMIHCHNCGHGVDARGCPHLEPSNGTLSRPAWRFGGASDCANPEEVRKARAAVRAQIRTWLAEPQDPSASLAAAA